MTADELAALEAAIADMRTVRTEEELIAGLGEKRLLDVVVVVRDNPRLLDDYCKNSWLPTNPTRQTFRRLIRRLATCAL